MPKRVACIIAAVLWTAAPGPGVAQLSPADGVGAAAELLEAREAVWRAWFDGDQQRLAELLPPDLIAINNADSVWHDRATTIQAATEFARAGGRLIRLAFPRTESQTYGNVAVLYSLWEFDTEEGGERKSYSGRATEVFVREGGRWLNTGWHLDSGR